MVPLFVYKRTSNPRRPDGNGSDFSVPSHWLLVSYTGVSSSQTRRKGGFVVRAHMPEAQEASALDARVSLQASDSSANALRSAAARGFNRGAWTSPSYYRQKKNREGLTSVHSEAVLYRNPSEPELSHSPKVLTSTRDYDEHDEVVFSEARRGMHRAAGSCAALAEMAEREPRRSGSDHALPLHPEIPLKGSKDSLTSSRMSELSMNSIVSIDGDFMGKSVDILHIPFTPHGGDEAWRHRRVFSLASSPPLGRSPPYNSGEESSRTTDRQASIASPSDQGIRKDLRPLSGLEKRRTSLSSVHHARTGSKASSKGLQILNPFKLSETVDMRPSISRRRWFHLNPHDYGLYEPQWSSICEPAVLPVTTDYWPPTPQLATEYQDHPHTVSLLPGENDYQDNTLKLLHELIGQRLLQDFQIVVPSDDTTPSLLGVSFLLSIGHQFHVLSLDTVNQNIEVKRYIKRWTPHVGGSLQYRYRLWPWDGFAFLGVETTINTESDTVVDWNYYDQFIAGFESTITPPMRERRIRFALIPEVIPNTASTSNLAQAKKSDNSPEVLQHKRLMFLRFKDSLTGKGPETMDVYIDGLMDAPQRERPPNGTVRWLRQKMDSKSDRFEWIFLYYDAIYNPSMCWHFEISWLVARGSTIDDFVQMCSRKAKMCGLTFVHVPIVDETEMASPMTPPRGRPFQLPTYIDVRDDQVDLAVTQLQKSFNFYLDCTFASFTQYVHRSGAAFVRRVRGSPGLFWINHHLTATHALKVEASALRSKFMEHCQGLATVYSTLCEIIDAATSE